MKITLKITIQWLKTDNFKRENPPCSTPLISSLCATQINLENSDAGADGKILDTCQQGGWTVVTRTILQSTALPSKGLFGTYDLIDSYSQNDKYIIPKGAAMLDILQKMGFHQIHFYCRKESVGRVLSIMTRNNTAGQAVVSFFTDDEFAETNFPDACGSFDRLPEDASILAQNCYKWGQPASGTTEAGKWGYYYGGQGRITTHPFVIVDSSKHGFGCSFSQNASVRCYCDYSFAKPLPYNVNDTWRISVR